MKIRIIITLKKGVLDTQGKAIEASLQKNLGFPQISQVRQGKVVELDIAETDPAIIKNIVDEITRVAMAFPNVGFRLTNNETDIFLLEPGNQKQRIVALLGNAFNAKLVATEQDTEYVKIKGFIGTPQAATKTRGNQFFFVNNRFIKSAYLNHAVSSAYQSLIAKDEFPAFVLFLDISFIRFAD
jgi:phosphoribosylformylglycinamidine synthase PurS subunit